MRRARNATAISVEHLMRYPRRNLGFIGTAAAATVGNFAAHGIRSAFGRRNPGRYPSNCPECEAPGYRWIRCPECSTDAWSCRFCGFGEPCVCAEFNAGELVSDYVPPLPPVPGELVTDYRAHLQWPRGRRQTRGNPPPESVRLRYFSDQAFADRPWALWDGHMAHVVGHPRGGIVRMFSTQEAARAYAAQRGYNLTGVEPPSDAPRVNPGKPDPPSHVSHLLREFHSREPQKTVDLSRAKWPERMRPIAHAVAIYYDSDKKDPGDPNDQQGKPKAFIHTFDAYESDGPPVLVYEAGDGEGAITTSWPEWIVYLGTTPGWVEEDDDGQRERRVRGGTLAATEDGTRLIVIDKQRRVHLFDGGGLVVTWRGIEG